MEDNKPKENDSNKEKGYSIILYVLTMLGILKKD